MNSEQLFLYATRGLSLFCIVSALIAFTFLPPDVMDAAHYWHLAHSDSDAVRLMSSQIYFFRIYLLRSADLVLQIAVLLLAAGWFYCGGTRLRRFFSLDPKQSGEATTLGQ